MCFNDYIMSTALIIGLTFNEPLQKRSLFIGPLRTKSRRSNFAFLTGCRNKSAVRTKLYGVQENYDKPEIVQLLIFRLTGKSTTAAPLPVLFRFCKCITHLLRLACPSLLLQAFVHVLFPLR